MSRHSSELFIFGLEAAAAAVKDETKAVYSSIRSLKQLRFNYSSCWWNELHKVRLFSPAEKVKGIILGNLFLRFLVKTQEENCFWQIALWHSERLHRTRLPLTHKDEHRENVAAGSVVSRRSADLPVVITNKSSADGECSFQTVKKRNEIRVCKESCENQKNMGENNFSILIKEHEQTWALNIYWSFTFLTLNR